MGCPQSYIKFQVIKILTLSGCEFLKSTICLSSLFGLCLRGKKSIVWISDVLYDVYFYNEFKVSMEGLLSLNKDLSEFFKVSFDL